MNIVLVLIPLSLILLAAGVWAFFWGVNHAQFDDLETPALMPLSEDVRVDVCARQDVAGASR